MLRGLLGLPANTREAITWLKRAAENADYDNPQALNILVHPYQDLTNHRLDYTRNQMTH
jgi:TPR repeat protein